MSLVAAPTDGTPPGFALYGWENTSPVLLMTKISWRGLLGLTLPVMTHLSTVLKATGTPVDPTNFRKNSNRLWFLRVLPMLRADDAQPDRRRR